MAAGCGAGGAWFRRRRAGGAARKRASGGRTARPDLGQFDRGDAKWIARRPRSAYPWRGSGGPIEPAPAAGTTAREEMMTSLKGKTLFVSGGSRGIGLAI